MKQLLMPAMAGALVAMSGAAFADTAVSAVADLNVRAGPGPRYPVVGVLPAGQPATLQGCMENSKWCTIAEADGQGWVYSDYLTADFGAGPVVLTDRPTDSDIAIVQPPSDIGDYPDNYTAAIAPGDAIEPVDPPPQVRTYIRTHEAEPVYLEGEVVSGAVLPDSVVLQPIPDYDYSYVYVNGEPALIDPATRRVVYVVR